MCVYVYRCVVWYVLWVCVCGVCGVYVCGVCTVWCVGTYVCRLFWRLRRILGSWFTVLYLSPFGTWPVIELGAEPVADKFQQFCVCAPTELVTGVHSIVPRLICGF